MDTTNSSFNYSEGIFMALGPDDLPYAQEYIFFDDDYARKHKNFILNSIVRKKTK